MNLYKDDNSNQCPYCSESTSSVWMWRERRWRRYEPATERFHVCSKFRLMGHLDMEPLPTPLPPVIAPAEPTPAPWQTYDQ